MHKKTKQKKVAAKGKNIRIPEKEFEIIKEYVDLHNHKIGGFMATATIEKINKMNNGN